jgi:putative transposase
MSHSHVCCLVHVVFATAERRPFIRDEIRERLHGYLTGIARENEIQVLAVGGTADHVHLLISLPRTISIAKAVQLLKSESSKWIHESFRDQEPLRGRKGTERFRSVFRKRRRRSNISWLKSDTINRSASRTNSRNFFPSTASTRIPAVPNGTGYNRLTLPRTASWAKFSRP